MTGYLDDIAGFAAGTLDHTASLPAPLSLRPRSVFEDEGAQDELESITAEASLQDIAQDHQRGGEQSDAQDNAARPMEETNAPLVASAAPDNKPVDAATQAYKSVVVQEVEGTVAPAVLPSHEQVAPEQILAPPQLSDDNTAQPAVSPDHAAPDDQPQNTPDMIDTRQPVEIETSPSKSPLTSADDLAPQDPQDSQDPQNPVEDAALAAETIQVPLAPEGVNVSIGRIEVIVQPPPFDPQPLSDPIPMPPPPTVSTAPAGPLGTAGFDGYAARRRGALR